VGHKITGIVNHAHLTRHLFALLDDGIYRIGLADIFEFGSKRKVLTFHVDKKNFFFSEELKTAALT
jgi:hypothetical protein